MDGKKESALEPFDEAWFDVANPCGKEFDLPNVCTPINPEWSDKGSLVFFDDQRPEMTSPSRAGNQLDSFPLIQMVPSITNSFPAVDLQEGSSLGNYHHFPTSGSLMSEYERSLLGANQHVFVPTLTNEAFHANSTNSQSISSANSLCLEYKPTHASRFANRSAFGYVPTIFTSPNPYRIDSNYGIINDHVCFSGCGCFLSFGSGGFPSVNNQEFMSSFNNSPSFLHTDSRGWWNQVAYDPAMTNTYWGSANRNINYGPNFL